MMLEMMYYLAARGRWICPAPEVHWNILRSCKVMVSVRIREEFFSG